MQKFICSLSWTYTPLVLLCSGLKSKSNFWRKQLLRSLVLKQSSQLFAWCHHETKESLNGKGISEKQNQILKKNILLLKISKNSGKVNTIAKKNMINCWGENCSMDFFKGKKEKKFILTGVYQIKQKSNHIVSYVKMLPVKQRRSKNEDSKLSQNCSHEYWFQIPNSHECTPEENYDIHVCQKMFWDTLGISKRTIKTAFEGRNWCCSAWW